MSKQLQRVLDAYSDASKAPLLQSQASQHATAEEQDDAKWNKDNKNSTENVHDDFSRNSILLGCFYLCVCFGATVWQYVPVYYADLGFNAREIGILGSAQPFVAVIYTPFVGYIADRFSIRRQIMIASLTLHAIAGMGIYYIPRIRIKNCDSYFNNTAHYDFTNCSTSSHNPCPSYQLASIYNALDLEIVFVYLLVLNVFDRLVAAPWVPISDSYILAALGSTRRNLFGYFKGIGGIGHCCG